MVKFSLLLELDERGRVLHTKYLGKKLYPKGLALTFLVTFAPPISWQRLRLPSAVVSQFSLPYHINSTTNIRIIIERQDCLFRKLTEKGYRVLMRYTLAQAGESLAILSFTMRNLIVLGSLLLQGMLQVGIVCPADIRVKMVQSYPFNTNSPNLHKKKHYFL